MSAVGVSAATAAGPGSPASAHCGTAGSHSQIGQGYCSGRDNPVLQRQPIQVRDGCARLSGEILHKHLTFTTESLSHCTADQLLAYVLKMSCMV